MFNINTGKIGALIFSSLVCCHAFAVEHTTSPLFMPMEDDLIHPMPALESGPFFPGILGQALADIDNDGDLDLFVTNSEGLPNYLYLNDGHGHFVNVAHEAGVSFTDSYSVSVGLGDFDNDGLLDLLVGRQINSKGDLSHPLMLKNMGMNENNVPVFVDVSERSGIADLAAGTKALGFAVADYNQDGKLDIFIGAFDLRYSGDVNLPVGTSDPNLLLINTGNNDKGLRFVDHTQRAGVAGVKVSGRTPETEDQKWYPHTWAVYASDVDANGLMDIIVMNEAPGIVEVQLNQGNGKFQIMENDQIRKAGGWMGIASTDFNGDGNLDYFITNLGAELSKFGLPAEINLGAVVHEGGQPYHFFLSGTDEGTLTDIAADLNVTENATLPSQSLGLAPGLQSYGFGWGATFFDADNDGYKDLYWVGAHWTGIPLNGVGRFLLNEEGKSFSDITDIANLFNIPKGESIDFSNAHNGYSVLSGDIDNDGDDDLVVVNGSDSAAENAPSGIRIFKNLNGNENRQIKIQLRKDVGERFGIGSRIELLVVDSETTSLGTLNELDKEGLIKFILNNFTKRQVGEVVTTTGSFSAVQPMVSFGLNSSDDYSVVRVTWPDGKVTHDLVLSHQSSVEITRCQSWKEEDTDSHRHDYYGKKQRVDKKDKLNNYNCLHKRKY